MTFQTHDAGLTTLGLMGNIGGPSPHLDTYLGDANALPILLTQITGADIQIEPRPDGNIPEPSSLLLLGLGLPILLRRLGKIST